ncbi:hypothetical protein BS47DRAFT_1027120 [Hydnum rufescens UP504]|uniref:Uncharacterized protein n=1 Tax=Hydnum rufescens UP504 TaxID=1448309 RepID=A0A9P6AWG9_9AGAM|nr:hypothetical protein BS47DRAFT_1027120 [Hydnum rufescens UP504]
MSDNPRDSRSSDDGKSRSLNGLILRRSSYNPAPRQRDSSHRSQWPPIRSQSIGIYNDVEEDGRWDSALGNSVDTSSAYGRDRTPSPIHPRGVPFPPAPSFNHNSDQRNRSGSWERLPGKSPQRSAWSDERGMPPASGPRTERPRDWSYER